MYADSANSAQQCIRAVWLSMRADLACQCFDEFKFEQSFSFGAQEGVTAERRHKWGTWKELRTTWGHPPNFDRSTARLTPIV